MDEQHRSHAAPMGEGAEGGHRDGATTMTVSERQRQLRFAAALAHSAPHVTLEVFCVGGSVLTVAHHRLDAQLDPCQFRSAVLESHRPGMPRLCDAVLEIRVVSGPQHLGGGVYRVRDANGEQRWFLTELDHGSVARILAGCPVVTDPDSVNALTRPDPCLGITAVRLAASPGADHELDQVAFWAAGEVMVAELITAAATASSP